MMCWWHRMTILMSNEWATCQSWLHFFSLTSSFVKTPCEHEHQTRTKNAFFCSPDKWSKATTVNLTQEWIKAVWICNPQHIVILEISELRRTYYLISFVFDSICVLPPSYCSPTEWRTENCMRLSMSCLWRIRCAHVTFKLNWFIM